MANPSSNDEGWRLVMSREDRIKVCQHIMGKLASYYHMVPEQALREKTSAFESQAYTNAESRTDYLKRIAGGLSNVERQVQQATSANANMPHPQANGTATTATNPAAQVQAAVPRAGMTPQQAALHRQQQQQQQILHGHGQMASNQYALQMRQQLLMQQQQHAKQQQQLSAKAGSAAARAKGGNTADVKATNSRTRSSSSSAAGGSGGGRSKSAQNQALGKTTGQQGNQGRPASFNAAQGPAAGAAMTPEFLLAMQNQQSQSQFTQQALQQAAQAAQLARQQNGQGQAANAAGGMAGMGLNAAAVAKTGNRVPGAAAMPGFLQSSFPNDISRKFSPEQLNQISSMTNPQNTLGLQGNVPGGVSAALSVGNAAAISQAQSSRAMSAQMLQHNRLQQGVGMQSGNPNSFARAAIVGTGMTVSEMNAMMAQTAQTTNAETIRAAQQGAYGNFPESVRPRMGQGQAGGQRLQNPGANASAADEQFWQKLEYMKTKYRTALLRIAPITQIIADGQPPAKQEQFRKHLKDCFHILDLERTDNVPPRLTTQLLEKAERFINGVIQVYNNVHKNKSARALNAANGGTGSAQENALRAQQYAAARLKMAKEQSHASPQNQQHQHQMQLMSQLQQQHQLNQLPGSSAMSAASKAAKTGSGRMPNRANHNRVSRQQVPPQQAALQGAQLGMGVKPEQLASGMSAYGIPPGATPTEQELKLLQQRRHVLHAQQAQQAQQHSQHLSQSFQHPSMQQGARAKVQAQLAHGSQALPTDATRMMDPLHMQQLHEQLQRSKFRQQQQQAGNGAAALATPPQAAKHARGQAVDPMVAKQEAAGAVAVPAGGRSAVVPTPAPGARRPPGATLEQKMQHMQSSVKLAVERAERYEQYVEKEAMRGRAERIQNTLAALRNVNNSSGVPNGKKRGLGHTSLVDVENHTDEKEMIKAKTVFEASSEQGLRLAKRPKNEAADLKSLKEAVEADCRSAQERNPLLNINITEEFGQPVVTCELLIEDIKLPKLVLRVQRGYPRKGGATFGFERPPLGWVDVLDEIRTRFKRSLANAPATSVGVAAFLDAWVREAEDVIETNLRGHLKNSKVHVKQQNTLIKTAEAVEVK